MRYSNELKVLKSIKTNIPKKQIKLHYNMMMEIGTETEN